MPMVRRTHLVRLRFRDNDGAESTCEMNIHQSVALKDALVYAALIRPLIAALSSAICIDYSVIARWKETNRPTPGSSSDNQRVGAFIFETALSGNRAIVVVPSLDERVLTGLPDPFAGINIDQAHPDVAAFIAAMELGIGGIAPVSPFSIDLLTLKAAYRQERP